MSVLRGLGRLIALFLITVSFSACFPSTETSTDEQKDPHYLAGRSLVTSQDYKGAIEEFEKALEVNPRSASAHFELGWLNEEHMKDYAAAIYHYERHLKLRPESPSADRARERIKACKMDLAKTEVLGPVTQAMQRDLEQRNAENLLLRKQVEALQAQLAARRPSAPVTPAPSAPSAQPHVAPVDTGPAAASTPPEVSRAIVPKELRAPTPAPKPKIHIVKSGETVASISRQYGIKLEKLLTANPAIDPRRLKVGQNLTIPPP